MDLVIDSNILFAALLKDGGTSEILFMLLSLFLKSLGNTKNIFRIKLKGQKMILTSFWIYLSDMFYLSQKRKLISSSNWRKKFLPTQKMFPIWLLL